MKSLFLHLLKFVLLASIFFVSCQKPEVNSIYDLKGSWKVVSFLNLNEGTTIHKTPENTWQDFFDRDIILNFSEDNEHIKIEGHTITNTVFGKIYLKREVGQIEEIIFGGTEVNEPQWGRLIRDLLPDSAEFYVKNDFLYFTHENGYEVIKLERY